MGDFHLYAVWFSLKNSTQHTRKCQGMSDHLVILKRKAHFKAQNQPKQNRYPYFSVSISDFPSVSLRTCWWTTMWKSSRPTSTRPSARHRSCRNNQPSVWRRRRSIREEEKGDENRSDASPGLLIPPSCPWDTFLLRFLWTFHSDSEDLWQKCPRRSSSCSVSLNSVVLDYWTGAGRRRDLHWVPSHSRAHD